MGGSCFGVQHRRVIILDSLPDNDESVIIKNLKKIEKLGSLAEVERIRQEIENFEQFNNNNKIAVNLISVKECKDETIIHKNLEKIEEIGKHDRQSEKPVDVSELVRAVRDIKRLANKA